MSSALTKPCFSQLQSSPGIPCWCLGCVSLSEQFCLLNRVSGAPCAPCPSSIVPSRFPQVIGDNLRPHWAAPNCTGDRHSVCHCCQLCLPGWLGVSLLGQANLHQEPEDTGGLSEYHLLPNLGGFSEAVRSSIYCSIGSPFSSKCFISYLWHAKEDFLVLLGSGSAACALMRSGAHHWTSDLCSRFPSLHHGSDFGCLPSSLLFSWEPAHHRPQFRAAMWHAPDRWVQPLLPLPQTLILDSSEISASLPITVSRAKISPHREKWVLSLY